MIYLKMSNKDKGEMEARLLVLEPANIERIKSGQPASSPDGSVFIAYTPDAAWLTDEILKLGDDLSPDRVADLIVESHKRPEVIDRAKHPHINLIEKRERA